MSEHDILEQILAKKREHLAACKQQYGQSVLSERIAGMKPVCNFHHAVSHGIMHRHTVLIAEIKKASPSKGIIRKDFDPATLSMCYERAGATCISVLTDTPYFQGKNEDLIQVREHTVLPILRKDFIIDPYQVLEARAIGADAILLIMAALSLSQARELEACARELDLSVLVEVHNRAELDQALRLKTTLIGINNRNLKTLVVDLSTTETLLPFIPQSHYVVCESGIAYRHDIIHMNKLGVWAFLVGESLMREADVQQATRTLLEG